MLHHFAGRFIAAIVCVLLHHASCMRKKLVMSANGQELSKVGSTIDFASAVGDSEIGVGPLVASSSGHDEWADWGLAISGNGLMAEAGAAGVLRALSERGILEQLSTISSVSGGSWFNTQFGYSKDYYDGVIDPSSSIDTFYNSYQDKAMAGLGSATSSTWEGAISAMYDGFSDGLSEKLATQEQRIGNKHADLLFCTNLNGESLLSDNSTKVQLSSNGVDAFYTNPAFWLVPTEGQASWNVPGVDLESAKVTTGSGESSMNASLIFPSPTVGKIGAMSSAANGITSNPQLSALMEPQSQYDALFGGLNPDNGVCTTKGETCSFPSLMAIDGCYSDNLGFALNVGYLQKKHPGKNLRLMAVSSELCDRATDPTCIAGVRQSAFRSLFANSPYPTVQGWLPAIVPGPNRTIFAESITDEQALGQQTGYGGMTFTTGTFTTVDNNHFGVAAGTKVSILILNVNGPLYLQPVGEGVPTGGKEGLASVALYAYKAMNEVLSAFLANGRVSSDAAFLYYQNTLTAKHALENENVKQIIGEEHRCCCDDLGTCLWYPWDSLIHFGHCPRLWVPESGDGKKCASGGFCFSNKRCSQTTHSPGKCPITTNSSAYFSGPNC